MKCEEVRETFGLYWDLPEEIPLRLSVDLHLKHCIACREEFRLWEESEQLIRQLGEEEEELDELDIAAESVNRQVMDRIFAEEKWNTRSKRIIHPIPIHLSNRISAAVAACLAMFTTSLLYFLLDRNGPDAEAVQKTGLMETANAYSSGVFKAGFGTDVPVAQVSEPFILNIVPATPQYWIVLSMLGLILILFMLNWLSRIRK